MKKWLGLMLSIASAGSVADVVVPVQMVDASGVGAGLGEVIITESKYGLVFTPQLKGLVAGIHGFHLHEHPNCGAAQKEGVTVAGGGAGGHYDPAASKVHGTPWGKGHLGDLPPLFVSPDGVASQPVLAPRLKMKDIHGRALMIHAGGDNHSDHPAPLGGGGARVACGVIE